LESERAAVGAGMTRPNLKALVTALLLALMAWLWVTGRSQAAPGPSPRQQVIQSLERSKGLTRGLLWDVCQAETRCRMVLSAGRGKGGRGCDVGPWAIHVPDCNSDAGQRAVEYLMDWETNAAAAARILANSAAKCKRLGNPGRCLKCPGVFYNVHSKTWCGKVYRQGGDV